MKGSSFKSMFSIATVLHLKESFFGFFAGLGAVGGEVTGCSASESDFKTSNSSYVSDTRSDSSIKLDSSLSEDKSLSSETSGFRIDLTGTKNFLLE